MSILNFCFYHVGSFLSQNSKRYIYIFQYIYTSSHPFDVRYSVFQKVSTFFKNIFLRGFNLFSVLFYKWQLWVLYSYSKTVLYQITYKNVLIWNMKLKVYGVACCSKKLKTLKKLVMIKYIDFKQLISLYTNHVKNGNTFLE